MNNLIKIVFCLLCTVGLSSYCVLTNFASIKQDRRMFIPQSVLDLAAANPAVAVTEGGQTFESILTAIDDGTASSAASHVTPSAHVNGSHVVDYGGIVDILNTTQRCAITFTIGLAVGSSTAMVTEREVDGDNIISFDISLVPTYVGTFVGHPLFAGASTDMGIHIETAMRHEIMHGLGFLHNECRDALMFRSQDASLVDLIPDEIEGLKCLYGTGTCPDSQCCCDNDNNSTDGISPNSNGAADVLSGISATTRPDMLTWNLELPVRNLKGFNILVKSNGYMLESLNRELISYDEEQMDYAFETETARSLTLELVFEDGKNRLISVN